VLQPLQQYIIKKHYSQFTTYLTLHASAVKDELHDKLCHRQCLAMSYDKEKKQKN